MDSGHPWELGIPDEETPNWKLKGDPPVLADPATCYDMAHSLSSECTPLKHAYDSCFNAWFAGYLEPTLTPHQQREKDKNPQEYQKQKAEEYQQKCGKVWESYKECVQKAIKDKGLNELLDQAREENPLREPPPPLDIPSHGGPSPKSQ